MKLEITSNNSEDTLKIAEKIGKLLKGRAVIELRSDVGGGKTTFVRGLVKGLGSEDQVSSPTFTISRHYDIPGKDLVVHHFDFYRLEDPGLMRAELGESISGLDVITIVEWAGIVNDVLPEDKLLIEMFATGEDTRLISVEAGPDHRYIVEAIDA